MSVITLGTDCTGIDAVYFALKNIIATSADDTVTIDYKFASEIDPRLREYLRHTTRPDVVYDDLTKRDLNDMPAVDLYVAGFPCQTFSLLGKQKGFGDTRGIIIFHIIEYLRRYPPKVFILENVRHLKYHQKGKTFEVILDALKHALPTFRIEHLVTSPTDIGYPQSRKRLFIIGERVAASGGKHFDYQPKSVGVQLTDVLLSRTDALHYHPTAARKMSAKYAEKLDEARKYLMPRKVQVLNLGFSSTYAPPDANQVYTDCVPCLTRYCFTFYITTQQRFLTAIEALRLQGFEDSSVATYLDLLNPQNKNKTLACLWAANSICIPVLEQLLHSLLPMLLEKK